MNKFLLSAVTAAALFGVSSGAAQAACGDISLSVFSWQSAEAMANVDQLILSAGYGCNDHDRLPATRCRPSPP
jgi:glycine betaine/proline transport system substrate-binding protein